MATVSSRLDELLAQLEEIGSLAMLELGGSPPTSDQHCGWMSLIAGSGLPLTEEEAFHTAEEALVRRIWIDEFLATPHGQLFYWPRPGSRTLQLVGSVRASVTKWNQVVANRLPLGNCLRDLVRRLENGSLANEEFLYQVSLRLDQVRPSASTRYLLGMSFGAKGRWDRAAEVYRGLVNLAVGRNDRCRALANWANSLSNACCDREALAVLRRLATESSNPNDSILHLVTAARLGDAGAIAEAGYHVDDAFTDQSDVLRASVYRRKTRIRAGLQRALPTISKSEAHSVRSLGGASRCVLAI